jgi:hypothetical protein
MTIDASKVTSETIANKIEPTNNSRPHTHFTKHLVCGSENPLQKYDKNPNNSSLWSGGSRTIPALTCNKPHTIGKLKSDFFNILQTIHRALDLRDKNTGWKHKLAASEELRAVESMIKPSLSTAQSWPACIDGTLRWPMRALPPSPNFLAKKITTLKSCGQLQSDLT